jgi:hypothetical protein
LTVSTFFAFGMPAVLPQNDADEPPATLTGAVLPVAFPAVFLGETDGDGEGDVVETAEGPADAVGPTDETAGGAAAGAAFGVREEGAQAATRATTDTAKRLNNRTRTEADWPEHRPWST